MLEIFRDFKEETSIFNDFENLEKEEFKKNKKNKQNKKENPSPSTNNNIQSQKPHNISKHNMNQQ